MKKVLVITGNRAEYGLLYPILLEMRKSKALQPQLLVTGTHTQKSYGHTIDLIKKDGMRISYVVTVPEHASMLEALATEIRGIETYCLKEKPDIILVWGDRDESFAGAIVAGHMGIPLAHAGGGDISGSGVDEPIRHATSKFAQVHFPVSEASAKVLRKLGEEKSRIHMVGTTAFDLVSLKSLLSRKALAVKLGIDAKKPWLLFLQHSTPLDITPLKKQILEPLAAMENFEQTERVLLYPNSDTGSDIFIAAINAYRGKPGYSVQVSLPREEYLALLKEAEVIVGNSSSGIVEAGFFKTPVVNIGNRQKGRMHGKNVLHAAYDAKAIVQAIAKARSAAFKRKVRTMKNPYGSGSASKKIVRALEKLDLTSALAQKKL